MIKIDFHGSTHGHFLEYVTNVYIMQTTPSRTSIFTPPTYAAHAYDIDYQSNRQIKCGHLTGDVVNLKYDETDTIIRIIMDKDNDNAFFIALSNLLYKGGEVGFDGQVSMIPADIRADPLAHRNVWYSKISERDSYAAYYHAVLPVTRDIFNFSFAAFFCFADFCKELNRVAEFLNQSFFPDQSLYELWSEFIRLNQGWQSYTKCRQILNDIFANRSVAIDCTVIEQAWINYNLSKMCRLYTGPVFDATDYPTDTQAIYRLVNDHLTVSGRQVPL